MMIFSVGLCHVDQTERRAALKPKVADNFSNKKAPGERSAGAYSSNEKPTKVGRRDWTRTNDPHHVKVQSSILQPFIHAGFALTVT
jgi:hypothetical protein